MTIEKTDLLNTSGAVFSDCLKYRYKLLRSWDETLPMVVFIMLNPSTADEMQNDPTITRCINFAKQWWYGSMTVVNLFAWRSTDPAAMMRVDQPIGPENDYWLAHVCLNAERIVCAWGNHGDHWNRSKVMFECLNLLPSIKEYFVFKLNNTGEPAHPLYQPYNKKLVRINCDYNSYENRFIYRKLINEMSKS